MAQQNSVPDEQHKTQSNQLLHGPEPISPLHIIADPRFIRLLNRATTNRERVKQQKVCPTNELNSPSTTTINSNAWLPDTSTNSLQKTDPEKKKCLTPIWKNRLQGLLFGLAIAAVAVGITVAVFLTRSSKNSATSTAATGCAALQWNPIGVTVAGNGTPGNASNQLYFPTGVYVDSNNAIYVADFNNNRIQQWLPNAVTGTTVAGQTGICGSGGGLLCNPSRIYGDSQQTLYIADINGIYLWPSGSSVGTPISGSSTVGSFYGIFVDNNRNVYASVSSGYSVIMWTPTTSTITTVAGGNGAGYTLSNLYVPYGLTVDSSTDIIYVSNTNLHTIVAWKSGATNGTIVAGRNGTTGGGSYLLRNPRDVKRDSNGNLYVVDTGNNRALLFCQNPPNETAITIVDTNLNAPQSIALDSNLNVYIADYNNHRIQKFNRIV